MAAAAAAAAAGGGGSAGRAMEAGLDPLYMAHYRFRRRDFTGCIELCNTLLAANPYDQVTDAVQLRL